LLLPAIPARPAIGRAPGPLTGAAAPLEARALDQVVDREGVGGVPVARLVHVTVSYTGIGIEVGVRRVPLRGVIQLYVDHAAVGGAEALVRVRRRIHGLGRDDLDRAVGLTLDAVRRLPRDGRDLGQGAARPGQHRHGESDDPQNSGSHVGRLTRR